MASPSRNGIAKSFTFDPLALELLKELYPHHHGQGHYVSSLILQEYARQEERARLKAAQEQVWPDEEVPASV